MGMTFFMGKVYPFPARVKIEFVKIQIPLCLCGYTDFAMISLATIGVCVFVRLLLLMSHNEGFKK